MFVVGPDEPGLPTGGDVWVLVIKNSKPSDSGIYVCEVNSNPIVRSFHKLSGKFFNTRTVNFQIQNYLDNHYSNNV